MHPSKAMLIDLQLAVRLNPLLNPNHVVNRSASKMLAVYPITNTGLARTMIETLSQSPRAYDAMMAGIKKLEAVGEL